MSSLSGAPSLGGGRALRPSSGSISSLSAAPDLTSLPSGGLGRPGGPSKLRAPTGGTDDLDALFEDRPVSRGGTSPPSPGASKPKAKSKKKQPSKASSAAGRAGDFPVARGVRGVLGTTNSDDSDDDDARFPKATGVRGKARRQGVRPVPVADTDNDDEHAKEGGAEKGGLDSLADMFKDDAPFDIGGGDALDSLDLGVFGGGGRGVARGVGGGRGNAGGRRASTPAQRLTRTKDDFLAELGLDEEEENADDVEEDDEDDQGLGQTSKGRSGLSALDELDRIEEEKLKQAEEFEKRRQEELKEQERLDEQALQLRRKEEAEAARRSQAQRQQQESAPPVAVPAPSSGKAASSPRSSDEWGGKDDMMDLLPDNDAPPAKPPVAAASTSSSSRTQISNKADDAEAGADVFGGYMPSFSGGARTGRRSVPAKAPAPSSSSPTKGLGSDKNSGSNAAEEGAAGPRARRSGIHVDSTSKKPTPSWLLDDVHEEPAHTQLDSKTSPPAPPPPVVAAAAASTGLPAPSPKPASQPTPAFSMASSDVNRSTAAGGGTGGLESSSNRDGDRVKEENKQLQAEVRRLAGIMADSQSRERTGDSAAVNQEVEALKSLLAMKDNQIKSLEQQVEDLASQRDASKKHAALLQQETAELQAACTRARDALEEERHRSGELDGKVSQFHKFNAEATAAKEELDRVKSESKSSTQALEEQLQQQRSIVAAMQEQVAKMTAVHVEEMASLKRMHEAAAMTLVEQFTNDKQGFARSLLEEKERALQQMAMIHHETMQVKQKEWENEVQLHQRHQVTAHQLFDLTQKVNQGSTFLDDMHERIAGEREKTHKERQERIIAAERNLVMREDSIAAREQEVARMRAQLEGVLNSFEHASRDNQVALVEERARVAKEHARAEAMLQTLNMERTALQDQVKAEKQALEDTRAQRQRDREAFLKECIEEKRSLATERAEVGKAREAAAQEEMKIRERLMELEGRIAKETAQHESDTRYCQEMKANLLVEAQKIASDREKLEQDKEAFQEETSKLMQLGLATQQKSAEAAAMREEAVGERQLAAQLKEEVSVARRHIEHQRRAIEDQKRMLQESQVAFEHERVRIAEERRKCSEERTAASLAAEQARSLHVKAAEKMRYLTNLSGEEVDASLLETAGQNPANGSLSNAIVASSRANRTSLHGAPPTPKGGQRRGSSGGDGGLAAHHRELLSSVRGTLRDIGVDMARYDQDNQYQADYLNTQSKFLQELKAKTQNGLMLQARSAQGSPTGGPAYAWQEHLPTPQPFNSGPKYSPQAVPLPQTDSVPESWGTRIRAQGQETSGSGPLTRDTSDYSSSFQHMEPISSVTTNSAADMTATTNSDAQMHGRSRSRLNTPPSGSDSGDSVGVGHGDVQAVQHQVDAFKQPLASGAGAGPSGRAPPPSLAVQGLGSDSGLGEVRRSLERGSELLHSADDLTHPLEDTPNTGTPQTVQMDELSLTLSEATPSRPSLPARGASQSSRGVDASPGVGVSPGINTTGVSTVVLTDLDTTKETSGGEASN